MGDLESEDTLRLTFLAAAGANYVWGGGSFEGLVAMLTSAFSENNMIADMTTWRTGKTPELN